MLIFSALNVYLAITGILVFLIGVFLLQKMAKVDPFMSLIFLRNLKYKKYYPAKSTPFAPGAIFKMK